MASGACSTPATSPAGPPEPVGALLATGHYASAVAPDRFDLSVTDDEADETADVEPRLQLPIEPETPSPENALFVLLGALIALAVVVRLVQLFG